MTAIIPTASQNNLQIHPVNLTSQLHNEPWDCSIYCLLCSFWYGLNKNLVYWFTREASQSTLQIRYICSFMSKIFKNLEKPPKVPSPITQKESNRTYWLMLAESMESKVFNLSSHDEICKETSIGCKVICNTCSSKCQVFRIPSALHYADQL